MACLVANSAIAAQDLGYMGELPAVARVIADNRVESARESAVRAHMALNKLAGVVQMLSQTKGRQPAPSEAAKALEYQTAAVDVIRAEQAKAATLCASGDCEGDPIARCSQDFMMLPEFSREVLDRYFSPQWQVQYAGALQGGGGVWRQALLLPPGTKTGRPRADADCADGSTTVAGRRTAPPTVRQSPTKPAQPAPATTALPATTKRPTGTANAILTVVAPISVSSNDTLYLLDDDLEHILTAAGFKPQVVLGQQLSLLQTLEVTARMKAQQASGAAAVLEAFGGSSALSAFGLDFAESNRQYQVATQAIAAHTVGTTRAAAGGPVRFAAVPAGTYWIWTTHEQAVTTGVQGTVIGSTVMVTPTGYQRPMMWNLKTTVVAGGNSVSLTQANAAWIGQ